MNYSKQKKNQTKNKAWDEMQKKIKGETRDNDKTQIMQNLATQEVVNSNRRE